MTPNKEEKLAKDVAFFEFLGSNNQRPTTLEHEEEFQDEQQQEQQQQQQEEAEENGRSRNASPSRGSDNSMTKRATAFALVGDEGQAGQGNNTQGAAHTQGAAVAAFEEDLEKKQMGVRLNYQDHQQQQQETAAEAEIRPIPHNNNNNNNNNHNSRTTNTRRNQASEVQSPPGAFRVHRTGMVAAAAVAEISTSELAVAHTTSTASLTVSSKSLRMSTSDALPAELVQEGMIVEEGQDESSSSNVVLGPVQELEEVMEVIPLPTLEERQQQQKWQQFKSRTLNFACLFCLIMAIFLGILFGLILPASKDDDGGSSGQDPPATTTPETTQQQDEHQHYPPFDDELLEGPTKRAITEDPTSPQYKANVWMWEDPNIFETYPKWRQLQRFGMVTKYYSLHGDDWFHNDNWLSYDVSECDWWSRTGPACDDEGHVIHEDLSSNNCVGTMPLEGQLQFLRYSDHSHNQIHGRLPTLYLDGLVKLFMSNNSLAGPITVQPGRLPTKLRIMMADGNQLEGNFLGMALQVLSDLQLINITGNRFGGPLDTQLRTFHNTKSIAAANNLFSGTLPSQLGLTTALRLADISGNPMVHGTIPTEFASIDSLLHLDVSGTSITGTVPSGFCTKDQELFTLVANCSQVQCCQ